MRHNKFFEQKQKGLAGIFTLIGMVVVSLVLPVATKLVQENQENRSKAALTMETDGGGGGRPTSTKPPIVVKECQPLNSTKCETSATESCICKAFKWQCTTCKYGCVNGSCKSAPAPTKTLTPTPTKTPTPTPTKPPTIVKECEPLNSIKCQNSAREACICRAYKWKCTACTYGCLSGSCKSAPVPTSTPTPTPVSTSTPTKSPTLTATKTPTLTLTPTPTPTKPPTPIPTKTPTATKTPTVVKTPTLKLNPTINQNIKNDPEVNKQENETVYDEISFVCNVDDKRCNGNKLEICKNQSETQIGFWSLTERCQYGCDSELQLCKADCGISEFMSNDMSAKPGDGFCDAGTMYGFDSETDNNSWVWDCGGNNLARVRCEAKRKLLKLTLSETSLILEEGKNKQIIARLDPSDKNEKINWQSSNGLIATVDSNGLITAVGVGGVKIKASTIKNRLAVVDVTVTANKEKCFANSKNYNNGETYCFSPNGKVQMICENGKWISENCKYGCSDNKCLASCGINIFYSRNSQDDPPESVMCELGKPISLDSEAHISGAVNDWGWKCKGEGLTTVECKARRAIYCDSQGGICVNSGAVCDGEYNGSVISMTDDCQKKAMVCCKTNTQIKIKKLIVIQPGFLVVGVKKQIEYKVEPNDTTSKIMWSSSNPNVVKIDRNSGMVEAVGPGMSKIAASAIGVDKQVISVSVVANENEICSKSNCKLCTKTECQVTDKCFWKNSECVSSSEGEDNFCKDKSGFYCNEVGARVECQEGRLASQVDNDAKCLSEMGCNSKTVGKYSCRNGNMKYQCIKENGFYTFQWLNLGKCDFGCSKLGECLGGYRCNGQWSERYDGNNKQVGNGTNCNYGCDPKNGRCLCSYGPAKDQKKAMGEYVCFDNAEYICLESGFFEKKRDCSRCDKDRCLEYNNENIGVVTEYQYKCERSILGFLGDSLSVKYIKGTDRIVGDKVLCQWGCENGKCQCRDNWGVTKRNGEKTCLNNVGYKCVDGNWQFEKNCFECKENGECVQSNETDKINQCQISGGVCVKDTLSCESGKMISSITTCMSDKPICCWQKNIKTITGITKMNRCKMWNTIFWPPYFEEEVDHGTIRCDENLKNLEICDNGTIRHYETCLLSCKHGKCINY